MRLAIVALLMLLAATVWPADGAWAAAQEAGTPVPTASGDRCAGATDWWAMTATGLDAALALYRANAASWAVGQPGPDDTAGAWTQVEALRQNQGALPAPAAGEALHQHAMAVFAAMQDLISLVGAGGEPASDQAAHAARLKAIENIAPMLIEPAGEASFLAECQPVIALVRDGEGTLWAIRPGSVGPGIPAVSCAAFATAADAQRFLAATAPDDPHGLDRNRNGIACDGDTP